MTDNNNPYQRPENPYASPRKMADFLLGRGFPNTKGKIAKIIAYLEGAEQAMAKSKDPSMAAFWKSTREEIEADAKRDKLDAKVAADPEDDGGGDGASP